MKERMNINHVAEAAGVSRATVSQVLRGSGRISAETRQRVIKVINDIGYIYNRAAANLRAGHSDTVGIAIESFSNPFFAELTAGAVRVLEGAGFFPTLVEVEDNAQRQSRFLTMLRENMMAGAILCPTRHMSGKAIADWQKHAPPTVGLLRKGIHESFDHVGVDNAVGGAEAARHLVSLGHRTIGFIGGNPGSQSREERLAGWRSALVASGIHPDDAWIEPTESTIAAGSEGIRRLMARAPLTAVVCHQDIVAFGVTIGLRQLGLVPGREVSVVGFDDISSARDWDPPLTTMSVTPGTLGAEAARMLLKRIDEPEAALQSITIRPRLVPRASTGPLGEGPVPRTA
jgi:LacI family transcriptional regulator